MKPIDVYKFMADAKGSGNKTMVFDGKAFPLAVGEDDYRASQLLLLLDDQMPNLTIGQTLDMLDAARWWVTFWASVSKASGPEKEGA